MRKHRHKIQVQSLTETQDSLGQPQKAWATSAIRRATVKPLSGEEYERASQLQSSVTHEITLRHIDVTTDQRILFDGRTFQILSAINKDERGRETIIMAKEQT